MSIKICLNTRYFSSSSSPRIFLSFSFLAFPYPFSLSLFLFDSWNIYALFLDQLPLDFDVVGKINPISALLLLRSN